MKISFSPALIFGLLAAFFWGTHSVIVRFLTADLSGLSIAVFRLYIAAAVLFGILTLRRHKISFDFRDKIFLVTVFGAATNFVVFHWGLEHTSASNAMMLENTAPFFVIAAMLVMGRHRSRIEMIATAIAMVGVYLTVRHDVALGGESAFGDALELVAGVTWAIFIISSHTALSDTKSTLERISFLFRVFFISAVILTPFLAFEPLSSASIRTADVVLLLLLGIFPTAVAYYLWYEAAARVSAVASSLLFTLSIIFTFIFSWLFLHETMTPSMLAGAVLIVGAVLLSKVGAREA